MKIVRTAPVAVAAGRSRCTITPARRSPPPAGARAGRLRTRCRGWPAGSAASRIQPGRIEAAGCRRPRAGLGVVQPLGDPAGAPQLAEQRFAGPLPAGAGPRARPRRARAGPPPDDQRAARAACRSPPPAQSATTAVPSTDAAAGGSRSLAGPADGQRRQRGPDPLGLLGEVEHVLAGCGAHQRVGVGRT